MLLVFTKSVDRNFRVFLLAPVTRNIYGYNPSNTFACARLVWTRHVGEYSTAKTEEYPSIFLRQMKAIVYIFTVLRKEKNMVRRFAKVSLEEIVAINEAAVPENTKKATKFGL